MTLVLQVSTSYLCQKKVCFMGVLGKNQPLIHASVWLVAGFWPSKPLRFHGEAEGAVSAVRGDLGQRGLLTTSDLTSGRWPLLNAIVEVCPPSASGETKTAQSNTRLEEEFWYLSMISLSEIPKGILAKHHRPGVCSFKCMKYVYISVMTSVK